MEIFHARFAFLATLTVLSRVSGAVVGLTRPVTGHSIARMRLHPRYGFVFVLLLLAPAFGRELVTNGNFEQEPTANGWLFERWGNYPDTGNCRFRWRHSFNPDRDFEVMVQKTLHRGAQLSQVVPVETLGLGFGVSAKMFSRTNSETTWTAACICLDYLDANDSVLGSTRIYKPTSGCTWMSDETLHLIRVDDTLWHDYHLDVSAELSNLPGVPRPDVRAIRVAALGFVIADC